MDEALQSELNRLRDEDRRQNHRLDALEETFKSIQELALSVHTLAHDMKQMLDEQREQGKRLDALEQEPGRKWRRLGDKAWDTAVGILFGGIATGLILMVAQYVK